MKIRAFISVDIPENIKKEIKKIQERIPEFKGKITETENLHLTLKFLGWINGEKLEETRKQLRKIRLKSFGAEIQEIGFFYPRIIWLHMTTCEELQREVDEELSGLFERERRFMGHLTIARIRKVEDWKIFQAELKKIKIKKMVFQVKNFRLKKSVLSRKGPVYETLEEYPLM